MTTLGQQQTPSNPPDNYVSTLDIPDAPALDFTFVLRQKDLQD
jgi:hypothetical protein